MSHKLYLNDKITLIKDYDNSGENSAKRGTTVVVMFFMAVMERGNGDGCDGGGDNGEGS